MKWILFGAVLAVLLLFPQLLTLTVGVAAAVAAKPVAVAFALGLVARPYLRRPRRWTR
ncbi:hypothetical protein [Streptomyces chartreusis]|uniref:hypothetical protein n=1 Tax=Streptomyces chartreusis TaxID=1969 RepID=UPI003865DB44|nr:hypothetical protein OG938_31685 [Streptomyces chartreusis]